MSEAGNKQLRELINRRSDDLFSPTEKEFIRRLMGSDYANLISEDKHAIKRLYLWMKIQDIKSTDS